MASNPFSAAGAEHLWYEPGTEWQRRRREWFDRAAVFLTDVGGAWGLHAVHAAALTWARTGREPPSAGEVMALFPAMDVPAAAAVARRSAALRALNRAAIALVQRRGLAALARFVSPRMSPPPFVADTERGTVMVGFHVGAHYGLGAALATWGGNALLVPAQPLAGAERRAQSLKRAIDHVRSGRIALVAADGPGGLSSDPVTCLGRRIVLRRGPFVLARQTGAPVVPAVARWTSPSTIDVAIGPSIPVEGPGPSEVAAVATVASWLENHLLAHPEDLWPFTIRSLLQIPMA